MQMVVGPLREPPLDQRGLAGGIVVDDQMDVQVLGDGGIDRVQELSELDCPVPAMALADHATALGVEGRE